MTETNDGIQSLGSIKAGTFIEFLRYY